jgi:hypothetical protein
VSKTSSSISPPPSPPVSRMAPSTSHTESRSVSGGSPAVSPAPHSPEDLPRSCFLWLSSKIAPRSIPGSIFPFSPSCDFGGVKLRRKIVLLGNSKVGKSSLFLTLVSGRPSMS